MTDQDKQIIADYMGWKPGMDDWWRSGDYRSVKVNFDLNDAGLCVKEMQRRGDWKYDFMDFVAGSQKWNYYQCVAWLYDADNFFTVFVAWLKKGKK